MERIGQRDYNLSGKQKFLLIILRIIIGWHLLYEGIAKLLITGWTSGGYLENSKWVFSGMFHWMAANESVLQILDFLNIWGLVMIGLFLILGFAIRYAGYAGIILLALYYIENPPFIGTDFGIPVEGHNLFINKTFVEIVVLAVVMFFPSGEYLSLDNFIKKLSILKKPGKTKADNQPELIAEDQQLTSDQVNRRETLKFLTLVPILGTFIYGTLRKYNWEKVNAVTGATIKVSDTKLKDLKGQLPHGKIKDYSISRVIIGGNLIGDWAHSIQALKACEKEGIEPDFYMKTLHHDQYWSAHPRENRIPFSVDGERSANHDEFHDNMFCLFADETIEFIKNKQIPFMAFKILAVGLYIPKTVLNLRLKTVLILSVLVCLTTRLSMM